MVLFDDRQVGSHVLFRQDRVTFSVLTAAMRKTVGQCQTIV